MSAPTDSLGADWAESLSLAGTDDAARRMDTSWLHDSPDRIALPYAWAGASVIRRSPEYVVKGLIGPQKLVTIVGAPGAGKSFWGFGLATAITSDRMWNGHRVRKGAALWLGLEGQTGMDLRAAAHQRAGLLELGAPLALVTVPVSLLANADDIISTALVAAAEVGERPVLTVLDTLSRALAGENENDGEVMTAAVRASDRIAAETGSSVVLIHHFGKSEAAGARGHSSLLGAVDVQIDLLRNGDDRRAIVRKNRDGEEGREYPFRLEVVQLGEDDEGDPITSCIALPSDAPSTKVMAARTPNQRNAIAALRIWCGTHPTPPPILVSEDLHKLLSGAGITTRQRRFDVVAWLANAGVITQCPGGVVVHSGVLK
jgi:hypothetical protein